MPADIKKLVHDKELILSYINAKGPSLPVHAARTANLSILFASAFLSELFAEGKVKMSCMKVGSSSLFYLPGQEAQLENFIEYLNQKEKEAFLLLKKSKILSDENQVPAIRVALREIKDFAIPVKASIDSKQKLFWKYFLIPDSEISKLIQLNIEPNKKNSKEYESGDLQNKIIEKEKDEILPEKEKEELEKSRTTQQKQQLLEPELSEKINKKEKKKSKIGDFEFIKAVKEFLSSKNFELINIFIEKKKELLAIIRADSPFGKQEYFLIAKDKKKLNEADITFALEKSQTEKMPSLLIAPGELDKKSSMKIIELRNLIKFMRL